MEIIAALYIRVSNKIFGRQREVHMVVLRQCRHIHQELSFPGNSRLLQHGNSRALTLLATTLGDKRVWSFRLVRIKPQIAEIRTSMSPDVFIHGNVALAS